MQKQFWHRRAETTLGINPADQVLSPVPAPGTARLPTSGAQGTRTRFRVLLLISLMYMICYIDRANISVAAPSIASEYGFSKTQMALVFSAFTWAYAIGQIPGGWLADYFGPKKVLLTIVPFWSVMTAATSLAAGFGSMISIRFAFGLGEAGAFPTATRAMQSWFPKTERGLVQGVTHSFSRLAIAVTPLCAAAILTLAGWRWIFYLSAILGLAWAALFLGGYRNRPEEHPGVDANELRRIRGVAPDGSIAHLDMPLKSPVPWRAIFTSPNMWYIAVAYGCFFYGSYFYVTWFPTYLIEYRHVSLASAGVLASLPLIAAIFGDLMGGVLTDYVLHKTGSLKLARRIVAGPAMALAALCLIPAGPTDSAITAVLWLTASNFFLELVLGPAWAVPMDIGGAASGTVTSVMNMVGAVGASLSPLVFGILVSGGSWITPFYVTGGVLAVGAVIWLVLIDPERPISRG